MYLRPNSRRILEMPVSSMTYEDIANALDVPINTARAYVGELRRAGLLTQYVRPMKNGRFLQLEQARAMRAKKLAAMTAIEKDRLEHESSDQRTKLPRSVWDVYAQTLSPEEMARWFRLG